jgi:hypothetical protein
MSSLNSEIANTNATHFYELISDGVVMHTSLDVNFICSRIDEIFRDFMTQVKSQTRCDGCRYCCYGTIESKSLHDLRQKPKDELSYLDYKLNYVVVHGPDTFPDLQLYVTKHYFSTEQSDDVLITIWNWQDNFMSYLQEPKGPNGSRNFLKNFDSHFSI